MKAAIVLFSDPKSGSDEAAGRAFNALSAAFDFKRNNVPVTILFQGTATRWAAVLTQPEHPFHGLFESVKDKVAGVSCGCAAAFGATEEAEKAGFDSISENPVPGTTGLSSMHRLIADGYTVLTY